MFFSIKFNFHKRRANNFSLEGTEPNSIHSSFSDSYLLLKFDATNFWWKKSISISHINQFLIQNLMQRHKSFGAFRIAYNCIDWWQNNILQKYLFMQVENIEKKFQFKNILVNVLGIKLVSLKLLNYHDFFRTNRKSFI